MPRSLLLAAASVALAYAFAGSVSAADHEHAEHFKTCAKTCSDCQLECDSCFKHCLALVIDGKKEHAKTVELCADCGEFCKLCSTLCSRSSSLAAYSLEGCAKSCDQCAAACEKFPDDKHMAQCAKACKGCAKECRDMLKMVGGHANAK